MATRPARWAAAVLIGILACTASADDGRSTTIVRNDAVELTIASSRLEERYGPIRAGEGRRYLVVSTEWRNLVPRAIVGGNLTPTPYVVPALDEQLLLIVNGAQVAPHAALQDRPGVLPLKRFTVADPQAPTRGNVVFDVPADARDLLLVFLDERYGVMSARLAGKETPDAPASPPQKNELLEVFVAGRRQLEDKGGSPDTELLAVDLRLKSIHYPDPKLKCGKLVRWTDWQDYLQLVVDGTYAATAVSGPFDPQATILPEVSTGGEFLFRVPRGRKSLDLAMHFGEMATGQGARVRPQSIRLLLEGERPAAPPVVSGTAPTWKDAYFTWAMVERRGESIGNDEYAVLTFQARNIARTWEFLQPYEQLSLSDAAGKPIKASAEASRQLPYATGNKLLVPPSETRLFEIAYPTNPAPVGLIYASADPKGSASIPLPAEPAVAELPEGVSTPRRLVQVPEITKEPAAAPATAPAGVITPPPAVAVDTVPAVPPVPAATVPATTPPATTPTAPPATLPPTTAPARRFCTMCGAQLLVNAKFCHKCGTKAHQP